MTWYIYYWLEDYEQSDKFFQDALRIHELEIHSLAGQGWTKYKQERYDEAIKHFDDFIKKHSKSKWRKDAQDIYNNSKKELKKFGRAWQT